MENLIFKYAGCVCLHRNLPLETDNNVVKLHEDLNSFVGALVRYMYIVCLLG